MIHVCICPLGRGSRRGEFNPRGESTTAGTTKTRSFGGFILLGRGCVHISVFYMSLLLGGETAGLFNLSDGIRRGRV